MFSTVLNVKSTLSYKILNRSFIGLCRNIEFLKEDFSCDDCGETPAYIVADGKACGPTTRKVDQLHELDRLPDDDVVLCAGSEFQYRVFLSSKEERTYLKKLVIGESSMEEFLGENITSSNGLLVRQLILRLHYDFDELPEEYKTFLGNIGKYTSVSGFMQCTGPEALETLESYCVQNEDIRLPTNKDVLYKLKSELPPFMQQLLDILAIEKRARWLPQDVSNIVLQLIHIRRNIFRSAAKRFSTDYVWVDDEATEVSTQFYPNWKLLRQPKKYAVRNVKDADFCNKNYNKTKGFSFGIFSVGCSCSKNITLGFEINLTPESPHNLFRYY